MSHVIAFLVGSYLTGGLFAYMGYLTTWFDSTENADAPWPRHLEALWHAVKWPWTLGVMIRDFMREDP